MANIKNPNAAFLVWTYKDRLTHEKSDETTIQDTHEVVLNTVSLLGINTNKSKSEPNGTFTVTLAPYKNWVGFIAPGSWCAILMTQDPLPAISNKSYKAKPNELKLFGRINSIRASVHIDENGARRTVYVAEGEDWGSIFNCILYVDPSVRQPRDAAVGTANALIYGDSIKDATSGTVDIPTTTTNIEALINLWGNSTTLNNLSETLKANNAGYVIHQEALFTIPEAARRFLGVNNNSVGSLVSENLKTGILSDYDKYEETKESVGIIDPSSVFGSHRIWDVLQDNCNNIINELIADIRWEGNQPHLCLYKRIKPFITREEAVGNSFLSTDLDDFGKFSELSDPTEADVINSVKSKFQNVRRIEIPLEDVIAIDAGTNWADKLNFIEILPDENHFQYNGRSYSLATATKKDAYIADEAAFGREGMRAVSFKTRFYPLQVDGVTPNFFQPALWKDVLAMWHFNTHSLLNGTIEFFGQNNYIQVGDNIMVDAVILGPSKNLSSKMMRRRGTTKLLLHVENLSHNFTVSDDGARHWTTTVQFVRGVVTDKNGVPLDITALDSDTSQTTPQQEKNANNTFTTSGTKDPDVQKVRGT